MARKAIRFKTTCVKTLSQVEADPSRSNQHELNGVAELKTIFGNERLENIPATFSVRGDSAEYGSTLTWYDAREQHLTRSEYRLYFKSNPVMQGASAGDVLIIGLTENDDIHCELVKSR